MLRSSMHEYVHLATAHRHRAMGQRDIQDSHADAPLCCARYMVPLTAATEFPPPERAVPLQRLARDDFVGDCWLSVAL